MDVRELYRDAESIQVETPGAHDVIGLEKDPRKAGKSSGISHFGFRLVSPNDVSAAAKQAEAAGGHVLRQGEFVPGEPYPFVADPDGHEVEIWYEWSSGPFDSRAMDRLSSSPLQIDLPAERSYCCPTNLMPLIERQRIASGARPLIYIIAC